MPPQVIVTFYDADGDAFPIALAGHWPDDEQAERAARGKVDALVSEGGWRPTFPFAERVTIQR